MRILLTSDTHGHTPAITRFAEMLRDGDYDCGIIAADILDDGFRPAEMQDAIREAGMDTDDFLPELPTADESFGEYADRHLKALYAPESPVLRALNQMESRFTGILRTASRGIMLATFAGFGGS